MNIGKQDRIIEIQPEPITVPEQPAAPEPDLRPAPQPEPAPVPAAPTPA